MPKSKVNILKEKIAETESLKNKLKSELKRTCRHKNIEYKSRCTNDLVVPKWYQDSYHCLDCGLCAYSPEHSSEDKEVQRVSKDFEILYKKYWRNISCSEYRIKKFDAYYKITSEA